MAIRLETDGFAIDFASDAVDAFVFDDNSRCVPQSHLRPVDIIAEFPSEYLFIELKRFQGGSIQFKCPLGNGTAVASCPLNIDASERNKASVKRLANDLREKYYHSFIHRVAEGRLDKKVNYVCLTDGLSKVEIDWLMGIVSSQMPLQKIPAGTFVHPIINKLAIVDTRQWNKFPFLSRYGTCHLM